MKRLLVFLCIIGFSFGVTEIAEALPIAYNFSGNINSVSDSDNLFDGSIVVGGIISGTLSYDSDLPDTVSDPNYYSSGSLSGTITSSIATGNYVFQGNSGTIDLQIGSSSRIHFLLPYTSNPFIDLGSNPGRALFINFVDSSGTVFPDDSLPTELDLSDFTSASITIHADSGPTGSTSQAVGNIATLTSPFAPIPEPNTMLLLGSGLIGLVGFRRKFKKS